VSDLGNAGKNHLQDIPRLAVLSTVKQIMCPALSDKRLSIAHPQADFIRFSLWTFVIAIVTVDR
jgi:hypothetical protein